MTSAESDERPAARIVLVDANVLYSRVLRDYLLYAATQDVVTIRWSTTILAEVVEHLAQNVAGFAASGGSRLVAAMNGAFPAAEVEPDRDAEDAVSELLLPDEDDRHVLAAAVAVDADVLCTDNLRDFPDDAMDALGIRLMSADTLLTLLVTEFPHQMLAAHRLAVSRLPGATGASTVAALRRAGAPNASELMAALLES